MAVRLDVQVRNLQKLRADLEAIQEGSRKAVSSTVKDMKSRAPGWVATAVTQVYNIKKGEVTPKGGSAKKPQKKAASVGVRGETIETLQLVYSGNLLTPTHFRMKPTSRPVGTKDESGRTARQARPYQVTAEIRKGSRKHLGPLVFLGAGGGGTQLPFQRKGTARLPIEVIKSVSVPQMVTNEQVAGEIKEKLNEGLGTRLEHNMSRALGR